MEEKRHIPAMELWGYANGAVNLKDGDLEHLLFCIGCQMLVSEFIEALERLPRANSSQAA